MRIEGFRIQNSDGIRDTGWIAWGNLSAYLEKHRADESRILRAIVTIRPAAPGDVAPFRDSENLLGQGDRPVATGRFRLNSEERRALSTLCSSLRAVTSVEVSRLSSGGLRVQFVPAPRVPQFSRSHLRGAIDQARTRIRRLTPRGKTDPLYTIKAAALAALQEIKAGLSGSGTVTSAQIEQAIRAVISQTLRTEEEKQLAPAVASLRAMSKLATQIDAAKDWVVGNLPHFPSASPTVPTTGDGSLQSLAPHLSKAELQKLDPAFITHLLVDVCGNVEVVREREYDAGAPRVWRNALDTQCAKIQKLLDRPPERIAFADSALQRGELLRVVREQFAVFRKSMDALGGKARSAHRPSEAHINQFLRCLADHFGERLGRTHYREISELLFHLQLTKRQLRPREISVRAAKHRRQFPNAYRTERAAFKLDA